MSVYHEGVRVTGRRKKARGRKTSLAGDSFKDEGARILPRQRFVGSYHEGRRMGRKDEVKSSRGFR